MKTLMLGVLCMGLSLSCAADVAVIVAADNPAAPTNDQIERIFLGKIKQFDSGLSARPIYATEGSATRNEFDDKVLGKSASQLKAYWSKLLFSGKGTPPKEFGSDVEVISAVTGEPGTIGYVQPSSVTDAVRVIATF